MITALVRFRLRQPISREQAHEAFSATAPNYREVPGLIRKYYLLSEDGATAGGVYLWSSREEAEQLYNADWKKTIADRYGSMPAVTYFDSPVVVDNVTGEIISNA